MYELIKVIHFLSCTCTTVSETLDDRLALSPEEILLHWFNHHFKEAGSTRRVNNFSGDIKDSECYTILLNQITPEDSGVDMSPMQVHIGIGIMELRNYLLVVL